LWVGVSGDLEVLGRLAQRCAAAGRRCGLAMDKVRYRPHLTVGRSRGTPTDMNSASGALSGFSGEQWRITSVELVHSTLGAEVRHDTIATLPLS
jgi:2'-5' RNA ligase